MRHMRALERSLKMDKNTLTLVTKTPEGYGIYMSENEVGGRTYFSDEVGGGVFIWDTALISMATLECVLSVERSYLK